jgi:hypothetical protein
MFYDNCQHQFTDNVCDHCGLLIEKFFDNKKEFPNQYKVLDNKTSILDNLTDIPSDVMMKVRQNISRKQSETGKKVRNDCKNTFIQMYEAYIECGYKDFNPHLLAKQLSLSRKEINWCLKITSRTSLVPSVHEEVNKYISIVIMSPLAYLDTICERNNLGKYLEEIKVLSEHIIKEKDILYSSRPEYVAASIVKKFCENRNINTKGFSKTNNISDNALKKIINDIEEFF